MWEWCLMFHPQSAFIENNFVLVDKPKCRESYWAKAQGNSDNAKPSERWKRWKRKLGDSFVDCTVGGDGQIKEDKIIDKLHHLDKQGGRKREFLCWGTAWGCRQCGHQGISPSISSQPWLSPCPCSSSLHCLHFPHPGGNPGAVLVVLHQADSGWLYHTDIQLLSKCPTCLERISTLG